MEDRDSLFAKIDKAINSTTYLLQFSITNPVDFDVERFLLQQLRTGCFHYELVVQDLERGIQNYSTIVLYPAPAERLPVFIPRPGNVWNGKLSLTSEKISLHTAKELLSDLLSGSQRYFSVSALCAPLEPTEAEEVIGGLLGLVKRNAREAEIYNIEPAFLRTIREYYESEMTLPGYFQEGGRDLALAFKTEDELSILLTNGYQ
jgi:hypothetical protein